MPAAGPTLPLDRRRGTTPRKSLNVQLLRLIVLGAVIVLVVCVSLYRVMMNAPSPPIPQQPHRQQKREKVDRKRHVDAENLKKHRKEKADASTDSKDVQDALKDAREKLLERVKHREGDADPGIIDYMEKLHQHRAQRNRRFGDEVKVEDLDSKRKRFERQLDREQAGEAVGAKEGFAEHGARIREKIAQLREEKRRR